MTPRPAAALSAANAFRAARSLKRAIDRSGAARSALPCPGVAFAAAERK